jgi:hypothetical protein
MCQRTGHLRPGLAPTSAARRTGFLAQEVEQAAHSLGYQFDGVHAPDAPRDIYGVAYAQFVVPLVRAVQEQQQQIDALRQQNAALQAHAVAADAQVTAITEAFEARLRRLEAGTDQAQR